MYKEDFNKFIKGLGEAIDHVKTELMPDFDFDAFNHDTPYEGEEGQPYNQGENPGYEKKAEVVNDIVTETKVEEEVIVPAPTESQLPLDNGSHEEVDKW